jgi:polyferredoxin
MKPIIIPRSFRKFIQIASFLALIYAGVGWLNQSFFHWTNSIWLSTYSEKIAIVAFGVYRVASERNAYTRKRLLVLTTFIATLWLLFPLLTGSTFFNHHIVASLWFFAYLGIIFLFGRRADCSWNCPCVGIRDTAGDAFRKATIKSDWTWRLRHLKWLPLLTLVVLLYLLLTQPSARFTRQYSNYFYTVHTGLYFASLLVIPWTGNRNYCRYLCPWGALYGLISRIGFYKIKADPSVCTSCGACERQCDMGVPIRQLIEQYGEINSPDCVGCGRCIQSCPQHALQFVDVRDSIKNLAARVPAFNKKPSIH